jgi:hypothetical protein
MPDQWAGVGNQCYQRTQKPSRLVEVSNPPALGGLGEEPERHSGSCGAFGREQ